MIEPPKVTLTQMPLTRPLTDIQALPLPAKSAPEPLPPPQPNYIDQNAVSSTAADAKRPNAPVLQSEVRFEDAMLQLDEAPAAGSPSAESSPDEMPDDWSRFGLRDLLVVPGVNETALQGAFHQLIDRPDASDFLARVAQKLQATLAEARQNGYMIKPERLQGEEMAWLLKAVDPKTAGTYDYLKAVSELIDPTAKLMNPTAENLKSRQQAILRLAESDPFKLLAKVEEKGKLHDSDRELIGLRMMVAQDRGMQGASRISSMMTQELEATSGYVTTRRQERADAGRDALDLARGRLLVAARRQPAELEKFEKIYHEKIETAKGGPLSREDRQLLQSLGFDYDAASKELKTVDSQGRSQVVSAAGRKILSSDCEVLADPSLSPAARTYLERMQATMEKTHLLEQATADLDKLRQQAGQLRSENTQTQQELQGVSALRVRLGKGGRLGSQDAPVIQGLGAGYSLGKGLQGNPAVFFRGKELSAPELDQVLVTRQAELETKSSQQLAQIAKLDVQMQEQGQKVAAARQDAQQATAEADQAYQALSPAEQARFASLHQAMMSRAQRAIDQADRTLSDLDKYLKDNGVKPLPQAGRAAPQEAEAAPNTRPLAGQPAGNAQDQAAAAESEKRESDLRTDLNQQRADRLKDQAETAAMTHFLDRIQHLRHELVEATDKHSRQLQADRSRGEAQRSQTD